MSKPTKKTKKAKKNKEKAKAGKTRGKALKRAAVTSVEKFKEAAEFVYRHRDKIKGAATLVAAVLGTASQVLGKPSKSTRRKRKS